MSKYITYITCLLIFVWSIFALQYFIGNPTEMTIVLLLLLEIVSFIVWIFNVGKLMSSRLNVIVLIWVIYVILNTIVNSNDLFLDMRDVIWWPFIYFLFFFIALNDKDDKYVRTIIKWFPVLFIALAMEYLFIRSTNIFTYSESGKMLFGSSNGIYFNALLLPFAFLLNKKLSKYVILIVGLILVLLSFKRSALIFTVMVIVMALYYDFFASKSTSLLKGILISCIIVVVGLFAFKYVDDKTGGFISKRLVSMETDKGSGRSEIYENVWRLYNQRSLEYKLIGSGQNTVVDDNKFKSGTGEISQISAHNDFLEILYDFGIIGLALYLVFIFRLVQRLFFLKRLDDRAFQANFAAFIIFMVMSMVSHLVIYSNYFAYLVIIWAITEGMIVRKEEMKGLE